MDDFEAFQQARLKAEHSFLRRLRDVASRIDSAPQIEPERLAEGDGAKAEAAFQIEFTKFGVATALARPSGRPNLDSPDDSGDNLAFEQAVAVGSAALGKSLPLLGVAALNAFRKSVGTNRLAAGATGTLGGAELLGGIGIAALLGTIAGFLAAGKRSAKQQEELAAKLDAAEADIADTQPSVDALRELIPDTTDLLNYIAVHATHALERWEARIGPGPHEWQSRQFARERPQYDDFVAIAAAQLAVASLNVQEVLDARDDRLHDVRAVATEVLAQSRHIITSRV